MLHAGFKDTLDLPPGDVKIALQSDALLALKAERASDLSKLLALAEPKARQATVRELIEDQMEKGASSKAMSLLLDQASAFQEFPYDLASPILLKLPPGNKAEVSQIFSLALSSYVQNPHDELQVGAVDDFPKLVIRFWRHVPPPLALQAVYEILKQAKEGPKGSYQVSSKGGVAHFGSTYEYRLFELLPILRELDAAAAEDLSQQESSVRAASQQFPNSLQSLDPTIRDTPLRKGERSSLDESVQDASPDATAGAASDDAFRLEDVADKIASDSGQTRERGIAQAMQLPLHAAPFYPRMDALVGILRKSWNTDAATRSLALADMEKTLPDCPPYVRAKALFALLDLYQGSKDPTREEELLARIIAVAIEASKDDSDADDPNLAFKPEWPSTKVWDKLLQRAEGVSLSSATTLVGSIPDPEQSMIETLHFAGYLLGVSQLRMPMSVQKHGEMLTQTGW